MSRVDALTFAAASPDEIRRVETELARTLLVIPSIAGGALLERMLPSLRVPGHCIVVLDQGSTDNTSAVCKRFGAEMVQLHSPRTYTQACNIGLALAKGRGADFVYIANNDIRFVTDVARELLHEMLRDPKLGIVSCAQVVTDDDHTQEILSHRVFWDLAKTEFHHDLTLPSGEAYRLEADFCELTFACLRTSAAEAVGGLDDAYGFYHEDADLGFRLRAAGWNAAYLPQSQIQHFAHSTFRRQPTDQRLEWVRRSRKTFAEKHLGYGLKYANHRSKAPTSWSVINNNLFPTLSRFGMLDRTRPELFFGHPGVPDGSVLYSVWETSRLPGQWLDHKNAYQATYLPSRWNLDAFREAGFDNTHYVPLGVDTDVFQPWRPVERQDWGNSGSFTVLWFARNQHRKGLDVMLAAWDSFRHRHPGARLIVMGHGVLKHSGQLRRDARHWRQFLIHEDFERSISYREIVRPLTDDDVALLYRSVDCHILTSRAEGFGFSVVEALASGTLTIFPDYGSTCDMLFKEALTFTGIEISADYSDKDFADVGTWWEPDAAGVLAAMERAIALSSSERRDQVLRGLALVRSQFTWRHTAFAIRADLMRWQEQHVVEHSFPILPISGPDDALAFARTLPQPRSASFSLDSIADIDATFLAFDAAYYRVEYADIEWAEHVPLAEYVVTGWLAGRHPSRHFDTRGYLAADERVRGMLLAIHGALDEESNRAAVSAFTEWERAKALALAADTKLAELSFMCAAYHLLLHRLPDPGGKAYFQNLLDADPTQRTVVVEQLIASPEYADRLAACADGLRSELV